MNLKQRAISNKPVIWAELLDEVLSRFPDDAQFTLVGSSLMEQRAYGLVFICTVADEVIDGFQKL